MRPYRKGRPRRSAELQCHFDLVGRLPCCVSGGFPVTIHHVHGGSVSDRLAEMGLHQLSGIGLRGMSDWLVLPLVAELHCIGPLAIDGPMGVNKWERRFAKQADLVDQVGEQIGYSLWQRHTDWVRSTSRLTILAAGTTV